MYFVIQFISRAILQGIPILFGATGEIITEKAGNLNLGIPGIMYMGGVSGLMGSFFYEKACYNSGGEPVGWISVLIALLCTIIASMVGGFIFSVLTVTLRANQNVTGLAISIFGIGFGNFVGGSLSALAGGVGQISVKATGEAFRTKIPFLSDIPFLGDLLLSYGFLTYTAVILAILFTFFFSKTRRGLNLRAVGENPATADAAGINVTLYKYTATIAGSAVAGLGGLYFVMEYLGGTWANNSYGDRGWLAIALVIFALWKPSHAIWGSFLFGALYIVYLYIPNSDRCMQEIYKMLPYIVTVVVLILSSIRKRKENQPPESLGLPYFREER